MSCFDDKLYALNAANGQPLWAQPFPTGDIVLSSPAFANGVIYVGNFDYKLYAINASTGTQVWNYTTSSSIETSPAVSNGIVYFGTDTPDCHIYAIGTEIQPTPAKFTLPSDKVTTSGSPGHLSAPYAFSGT
jgi:outer membrane protein assembly factor BamB